MENIDDRKNIKIPPELFEEIDRLAVTPGHYQSVAEFVREAIRLRLAELNIVRRDDATDQKALAAVSA